ncbi:uncharacterized protein [Nicotiana tomentosiformis]|uniref:uncharacterized protein n=1 Tax=Nicotiana tomentosiformis TaxID=4098 RepID=UPI00388CC9B5
MLDLMNQSQSIHTSFDKQSEKEKNESRRRLSGSIDVARFILRLGFPFCGHDESQSSTNRGIFLKLLQWYGDIDRDIGSIILENAPRNEMMCSPSIQKDIVDACVKETITAIIEDLDGDFFGILVDESKDISHKEQMALVLRYVNKEGEVIERFVGIVHVSNTSAMSLKKTICSFLSNHSPSPTQIRGQGYDGASNMQGELNGVKTLILNESPSAYCIHCFAHQFQLTFVALAKKHSDVDDLFCIVTNVLNIVVVSFKRRDLLREHQAEKLDELLKSGEVHTGRGLNQERGLQRPDDTRWGSHYKMLDNLIVLFPLIIHVLEFTACECPNYADRIVTESLMGKIKGFDFAFMLHLMLKVLAMTNELNYALQRMDQDIVNVMGLLALSKQRLQTMRNSEFGSLMEDVSSFCDKHDIIIPKMDARYFPGKSKRRAIDVTYSYHLHVDIFYVVIDLHFQELNRRFDAVSTDLLLGMASLNPVNLFVYACGVDKRFFGTKEISDLAKVLVKSELHQTWPLVYLFIKLTLILLVATASVERAFSFMNYIKSELREDIHRRESTDFSGSTFNTKSRGEVSKEDKVIIVADQSQGEEGNPKTAKTLLVGIAIKRRDTIATVVHGRDTTLWHQRLGHMSEKGMKLLASKEKFPNLKWKSEVENQTSLKLKRLKCDIRREYDSQEFKAFCYENGIRMIKTVLRTPEQNGVADRMNRTLNERYRIWTNKEVTLSHLNFFGCVAYVNDDHNRKILRHRNVTFNENVMYMDKLEVELTSTSKHASETVELEEISKNEVARGITTDFEIEDEEP